MVKMMLIQVQFLKRELFKAMEALDEVVDSNRLNVQLLAAVPAFGLVFAGAKVGAKVKNSQSFLTKDKYSPDACIRTVIIPFLEGTHSCKF